MTEHRLHATRQDLERHLLSVHACWLATALSNDENAAENYVAGFMLQAGPMLLQWAEITGNKPVDFMPMFEAQAAGLQETPGHG